MKYRDQMITDKETGELKKNIIVNGTTTVVFGESEPNKELYEKAVNKLWKAIEMLTITSEPTVVKGVAKCHPDDAYDEKTGVMIASRKAELKARVKTYNKYTDVINILEEVVDLLDDENESIGQRLTVICDELNMELVGGVEPTENIGA